MLHFSGLIYCSHACPSSRSWWMSMWSIHSLCVGRAGPPAARRGLPVSVACSAASSVWGTSAWLSPPSQLRSLQHQAPWSQKPHPGSQGKRAVNSYKYHTHRLPQSHSGQQGGRRRRQKQSGGDIIQPPS